MTTTNPIKKVLIIKSSPALDASVSNEIADYLVEQLKGKVESYEFTIRDLAKKPAPIYDNEILQAFYSSQDKLTEQQKLVAAPSLEYIQELNDADIIVFASPMHNFSVTTLLKSYIDQICRMDLTFKYTELGPEGFIKNKQAVIIRNPKSTRPWQHVLEPLSGYLVLSQKLYEAPQEYAEGWNFGPKDEDAKPVDWILDQMVDKWQGDASWQLDDDAHPHEAGYLKLDISKAKSRLDWQPTWHLEQTLERIIQWHQSWLNQEEMQPICLNEINEYMRDMNNEND